MLVPPAMPAHPAYAKALVRAIVRSVAIIKHYRADPPASSRTHVGAYAVVAPLLLEGASAGGISFDGTFSMMLKNLVVGSTCVCLVALAGCKDESKSSAAAATALGRPRGGDSTVQRLQRGLLVARGLGAIDGTVRTNSLEALQCNYRRGYRWFEVDLALTSDGEIVCFHRGDEKVARLPAHVSDLPVAEVEGKKYAKRFGIPRFSRLLTETNRLGDVVLIVDPDSWSKRMLEAFANTVRAAAGGSKATGLVLQAYSERDLDVIAKLREDIGAGAVLNLSDTGADDAKIADLARAHHLLAVVAEQRRFTPWLAQRLHEADASVLVSTVNEHREIINLTRVGADGFYTDRYVPYDAIATQAGALVRCGATTPPSDELRPWEERNVLRRGDYRLRGCAKLGSDRVELANCGDGPAIDGPDLAVPPQQAVHVELEAEAGTEGARFWFDMKHKNREEPARPREEFSLAAKERKSFTFDVSLPEGSPGIETRLGLASKGETLTVHRLRVTQGDRAPVGPAGEADAGN